MSSHESKSPRRLPDRCEGCGQFVGLYPVGFYDDRFCASCYDARHPEIGNYGVTLPGTVELRRSK
jgi:hypothetical protein